MRAIPSRLLAVGMFLCSSISPAFALSPNDAAKIQAIASDLVRVVGDYHAIRESYGKRTVLTARRDTLTRNIEAKRQECQSSPEADKVACQSALAVIEQELRGLQSQLDHSATENENRLAGDVACMHAMTLLNELQKEVGVVPAAVSDALLQASIQARGALAGLDQIENCTSIAAPKETFRQHFELVVNRKGQHERQLALLRQLSDKLRAIADIDVQQTALSSAIRQSSEATSALARAGQGDFSALAAIGSEMQLFKQPESAAEGVDVTKGISGLVALLGGTLVASGKASDFGSAGKAMTNIASLGGALVYLVGDALKANKIPAPFRKMAAAVAANRMLGLAIQDMNSELTRAQDLANKSDVGQVEKARGNRPTDSLVTPKVAAADYLIVTDSKLQKLNASSNATLSDADFDELAKADTRFHAAVETQFESARQNFFVAMRRADDARVEVATYRSYAGSLHAAALKLRQMLGETAKPLCENETAKYKEFCALEAKEKDAYALASLLKQIDSSAVTKLAAAGQAIAKQALESESLLKASKQSLDAVKESGTESWAQYATAFRRWVSGVSSLAGEFNP
jgi:hypothetical protein